MLSLNKRVDYALIALAHLAERPGRISPAREIAQAYDLPLPLLMNLLKELNQHGWVRSSRGTKGGYEIGIDPKTVSLHDLILMLEGPVQTTECVATANESVAKRQAITSAEPCSCEDDAPLGVAHRIASSESVASCGCRASRLCPVQAPLKALNDRLVRFLREVRLADIISPGRKVDVPLESLDRTWEGCLLERPLTPTLSRRESGQEGRPMKAHPLSAGPGAAPDRSKAE